MKKLNDHSEECCIKEKKDEYWTFSRSYFGDFRGNGFSKNALHKWLEFKCDNPKCMSRIILNEKDLQDWLKEAV